MASHGKEERRHYSWRVKDTTMPWRIGPDRWRVLGWRMTEEEAAAYAARYRLEVQRVEPAAAPAQHPAVSA
jgi:hypothetical protein